MPYPTINYIKGDATAFQTRPAVIGHVCNNRGRWGAGFSGALSKRYKDPERKYRDAGVQALGNIQIIDVETGLHVVNMIAQDGIHCPGDRDHVERPIVYDSLYRCLRQAAAFAKSKDADLHMPKIGADRAKGDWSIIEGIIDSVCRDNGIKANVYIL